MSVATAISRISEIETALNPPQPAANTESATGSRFAKVLGQSAIAGATPAGSRAIAVARGEIGQAEQPPGSNDSPRIAQYRSAVAGAGVGPWCADFVSWAARQGGVPLGENGEGFQSVSALYEWAQRSGRAVPASAGPPQPGDLIVWGGEHVGIVEAVDPDGTIHTIEGNSSDQVSQRSYGPDGGGASGYVRLG
jgi:cell wall-associated NlpC family hydrolase